MVQLGLCCQFLKEPIRFRATTAASMKRLSRDDAIKRISALCLENAASLKLAVGYCAQKAIAGFRINSQILPLRTHPDVGYTVDQLPDAELIKKAFCAVGKLAAKQHVRLSFHPDQFVVLNSPHADVTRRSIAELDYQAEVAEWVGADVINIHAGGVYGDKAAALGRFAANLQQCPERVRDRLTLENDDRLYTPKELLPLCQSEHIPLVYDVHHHRCLPDGNSVEKTTQQALSTWNRWPLFHLSSPLSGWDEPRPQRHHDYIDPADVPDLWRSMDLQVDIEAKAKECAVLRLMNDLA